MAGLLSILFKPKSILGLLVAAGILFLMIAGATVTLSEEVHDFFFTFGLIFFFIGIGGWLFFIVPAIMRNISRLN